MDEIRVTVSSLIHDDSHPGLFILTLQEVSGTRQLSFPIGMAETQDITRGLEQIISNRPMTHDLLVQFFKRFSVELTKVAIIETRNEIFFAELICTSPQRGEERFDARPSDAIALALKLNVPICVEQSLLDMVPIS